MIVSHTIRILSPKPINHFDDQAEILEHEYKSNNFTFSCGYQLLNLLVLRYNK